MRKRPHPAPGAGRLAHPVDPVHPVQNALVGEHMELKGRTALVTGGAIRVGREIALALAERGADVAITYRASAGEAEETVARLEEKGVRACAARCDQRDPAQVEAAVREVEAALGPVDVLVNSASIFNRTP